MTAAMFGSASEPPESTSSPRVIREIEHKFRVHGLFVLPDLTALDSVGGVDDVGTEVVDSIYVDTADLRLIREGFALRRRSGGDDQGWHLKLPVAGEDSSVHDELRVPFTAEDEPPSSLTRLVLPIVRDAPLTEVARLRGSRHRLMIRDRSDVGVAILVDDTMEVLDRSGAPTARFRELELDPLGASAGTEQVIADVAIALNEAGGLGGDFVAKVVRALGPRATAPPEVPAVEVAVDDAGTVSVADVVAATVSRTVRRLRATDLDLRRRPDDAEAVHKARVATRRLRTALRTFRPWLDERRVRPLIAGLKQTGAALGLLREIDVVSRHLIDDLDAQQGRGDAARDLVTTALGARRQVARDDALAHLDSPNYVHLHELLVTAAQEPLTTASAADVAADEVVPDLITGPWSTLISRVDELSHHASDDDWHRVRLAAKRVRYTAEAVAPGVGPEADRFAGAMATVTDLLGDQHDAVVAERVAASLAGSGEGPAEAGFALGRVASRLRGDADAAAARFPAVWADASRPELLRWFTG